MFVRTGDQGLFFSSGEGLSIRFSSPSGPGTPVGGKRRDMYGFVHSLYIHALGEWTPSTQIPNWLARLAAQAPNGGNVYTFGGVFNMRESWVLPPRAYVRTEETESPYIDDYEASWANAGNIDVVTFLPDNFDSIWYDPNEISGWGSAIQQVLLDLIDEWETNAPNPNRIYEVYSSWSHLNNGSGHTGELVSDFTSEHKAGWIAFGLGHYQEWFELLVARLQAARPGLNIRLHNVNLALMHALRDSPASLVPMVDIAEDIGPHGRASCYFLAAIAEYIELFEEKPPADFVFDPAWDVHSVITEDYQEIVDHIWTVMRP